MSDTTPPTDGLPGLGDLFAMFGVANPLAAVGKTIEQLKRGVNDLLVALERFNATMESINGVAARVSALLDDVEEPIRALVPPLTRSIKAADAIMDQISGPIEQVAPGITRLAETLGSPVFTELPTELGQFIDTIGDVARRLQPLAQMAESAGGLFGFANPLAALRGGGRPQPAPPAVPMPPVATTAAPPTTTAVKKSPPKSSATKSASKTSPNTSPKKSAPKTSAAKPA